MGHSNIRITFDRYGHLFPRGDDSAELAAADAAFFSKPPPPAPTPATVIVLKPPSQEMPVEELPPLPAPIPAPIPTPVIEPISETVPIEKRLPPQAKPSPVAFLQTKGSDGRFVAGSRRYTVEAERADAAVLAHPEMPTQALARKIGVSKQTVLRARRKLNENPVSAEVGPTTDARTALGQFAPGPRPQPLMDKARAALLEHPHLSATAIARMIGVSKKTVLNAVRAPVPRSTVGRFVAGSRRYTVEGERAEDALLKHPGMPVRTLAKLTGVPRTTLMRAMERLNKSPVSAETPVSRK